VTRESFFAKSPLPTELRPWAFHGLENLILASMDTALPREGDLNGETISVTSEFNSQEEFCFIAILILPTQM
jgi:hypothetical protein